MIFINNSALDIQSITRFPASFDSAEIKESVLRCSIFPYAILNFSFKSSHPFICALISFQTILLCSVFVAQYILPTYFHQMPSLHKNLHMLKIETLHFTSNLPICLLNRLNPCYDEPIRKYC